MAMFSSGKSRPLYLAGAIVVVVLGYWWVYDAPHGQSAPLTSPSAADARAGQGAATSASAAAAWSQASAPHTAPVPQPQLSGTVASEAIAPDAWRLGDPAAAPSSIPLPAGVSLYEPVSLDMENPKYPGPGEQVRVPLPGGENLQVNVETNTTNPNGDYSWRGHLAGYGDEYPVVMTYGGNSVYATVTTPKGSYSLVSVDGSGWIYKNPSEFELSQPGARDSLEIPRSPK